MSFIRLCRQTHVNNPNSDEHAVLILPIPDGSGKSQELIPASTE